MLLRPPTCEAEAGNDLVEDEQGTGLMGERAHALEEARLWFLDADRLHDHHAHLAGISSQDVLQRLQVVVRPLMGQRANRGGNAGIAGGVPHAPLVPAVISAHRHVIPTGEGPGEPHCGAGRFGARLDEAHHLRAGDHVDDQLGDLHFQRMTQREAGTMVDLRVDGGVDIRIAVAEHHRTQGARVIDVLVPLDVPNPTAVAAYQVRRVDPGDVLVRSLAVGLGDAGQDSPRPLQQALIGLACNGYHPATPWWRARSRWR